MNTFSIFTAALYNSFLHLINVISFLKHPLGAMHLSAMCGHWWWHFTRDQSSSWQQWTIQCTQPPTMYPGTWLRWPACCQWLSWPACSWWQWCPVSSCTTCTSLPRECSWCAVVCTWHSHVILSGQTSISNTHQTSNIWLLSHNFLIEKLKNRFCKSIKFNLMSLKNPITWLQNFYWK